MRGSRWRVNETVRFGLCNRGPPRLAKGPEAAKRPPGSRCEAAYIASRVPMLPFGASMLVQVPVATSLKS